jgi:hypothetical protein
MTPWIWNWPLARPLPTQDNTNTNTNTPMPEVGFKPIMIAVFGQVKTLCPQTMSLVTQLILLRKSKIMLQQHIHTAHMKNVLIREVMGGMGEKNIRE